MASSLSPIALFGVALSFASLFGATAAQLVLPQAFFVASFDDKQSFIVSTDGQFLQGSLVIKQSITSSNKISIQLQSSGDIYSSGDLCTGTQQRLLHCNPMCCPFQQRACSRGVFLVCIHWFRRYRVC